MRVRTVCHNGTRQPRAGAAPLNRQDAKDAKDAKRPCVWRRLRCPGRLGDLGVLAVEYGSAFGAGGAQPEPRQAG